MFSLNCIFSNPRPSKFSNLNSSLNGWHDISSTNIYFQLTYITKTVGCIYPIQIYVFKNVYSPTMRPKGAENLSNLHLSPKGWHDISNTNKYIQLIYILLIEYFPTLRPKGSQKISKLHSSPRVGIIYPISPYIFN